MQISATASAAELRLDATSLDKVCHLCHLQDLPRNIAHIIILQLSKASVAVVRKALYESAEIQNAQSVAAFLPAALDAKLKSLIATVSTSGDPCGCCQRMFNLSVGSCCRSSFIPFTGGGTAPLNSACPCHAWRACHGVWALPAQAMTLPLPMNQL